MPTPLELGGAVAQYPVAFKSIVPLIQNKKVPHYPAIYGGFASRSKVGKKENQQRMEQDPGVDSVMEHRSIFVLPSRRIR